MLSLPPGYTLKTAAIRHQPLVRESIERLGIPQVFAELLPKKPGQHVSDAHCATIIIEHILCVEGPIALYNLENWLEDMDIEILLGPGVLPHDFNDDRLAACLDHTFDVGYDTLLGRIAGRWLASEHSPSTYSVHQDTTTLVLYGAFTSEVPLEVPNPAHGHSKDHRPDLKQLLFGLSLQGHTGIPIAAAMFDGNTSDAFANRYHLDELAGRLPDPDAVTLVADSKLVDAITLGQLREQGFHFISLLPNTFVLREQLIDAACEAGEMPEVRRRPGRKKADPPAVWRGRSYERGLVLQDPVTGERSAQTMRFLVLHSSPLAAGFEAKLPKRLKKDRQELTRRVKALSAERFACAADAQTALEERAPSGGLHSVAWSVVSEDVELPYPGAGRPRAGQRRPTKTVWKLVAGPLMEDAEAIETARRRASHFVLVTDHRQDATWTDTAVLTEYRQQSELEGHSGFRWLKGPAAISPVFLKTPKRIAALGLLFVLALMVRNYVQYRLRQQLGEREETMLGRNRQQTAKPTTELAFEHFQGVGLVMAVHVSACVSDRRLTGLNDAARHVLALLDIDPAIFTTPRPLNTGNSPPQIQLPPK